jgi:hypothetical protein
MYDVPKEQYVTVIREMLRHEDDLTNHRIMWLLVVQGLLVNAYVAARGGGGRPVILVLSLVGILITLSCFVMLYRSYQALGYLHFLAQQAKQGRLAEEYLPLDGWPKNRVKDWWREVWICPWIGKISHTTEPWLFLPTILMSMWFFVLLEQQTSLHKAIVLGLAVVLVLLMLSLFCILWVWLHRTDNERRAEEPGRASRTDGDRSSVR